MFDLHNLAPAIGQVNRLRSNDGPIEIPGDPSEFGSCQIQDGRGEFEPPDCLMGTLARLSLSWAYTMELPSFQTSGTGLNNGQPMILFHRGKAEGKGAYSIIPLCKSRFFMV